MRRFHSYGPVDSARHFCVAREQLVNACRDQLVGDLDAGGHYFTIWAPRQTGKTWLMQQVLQTIPHQYGDRFALLECSFGRLRGINLDPAQPLDAIRLPDFLRSFWRNELPGQPDLSTWEELYMIFARERGLWDRPLLLCIDEVDTLPPALLDLLVGKFRELYLHRAKNWLHGVALIGVRAVLGSDSQRGSPFNVQRSLHVPNLTRAEVTELYQQYQDESGQALAPEVVEAVYAATNGQPGLVGWFGELLTEKYNVDHTQPVTLENWQRVYLEARTAEPSNSLLNMIAKARHPEYLPFVVKLFTTSDLPFLFHNPLHNYLYLHGIIEPEIIREGNAELKKLCRFSSPFLQQCLYDALSIDLVHSEAHVLMLDPLDDLADVFAGQTLNVPALLQRYVSYLQRLKAKGINPWKDQPRRATDLQLTEAVGHFHLFAWLQQVLGRRCMISPEFPTGNGKVDLHLRCGATRAILEIKSFVDAYQAKLDRVQAARYAQSLGLDRVTLAMFLPVEDETVLAKLSGEEELDGVRVNVIALGWV